MPIEEVYSTLFLWLSQVAAYYNNCRQHHACHDHHHRPKSPLVKRNRSITPVIMSDKRPAGSLGSLVSQSSKEAKRTASDRPSGKNLASSSSNNNSSSTPRNPFLSRPTQPEDAIKIFLIQARSMARRQAANATSYSSSSCNIEIEARLGTLLSPFGSHDMRVLSSGPKLVPIQGKERVAHAFVCNIKDNVTQQQQQRQQQPSTNFEGGITRSNYLKWTQAGLSEFSPLR